MPRPQRWPQAWRRPCVVLRLSEPSTQPASTASGGVAAAGAAAAGAPHPSRDDFAVVRNREALQGSREVRIALEVPMLRMGAADEWFDGMDENLNTSQKR